MLVMTTVLYGFSADPIHYGHIDIISRAAAAFDEVVVGIGVNPDKKYLFSLEERVAMAQRAVVAMPQVRVVAFEGLLVDYAYEHGISVVVKGARGSTDFDYELLLHQVGESQQYGIDTFLLPAKKEYAHVSSTIVKAIQKEQGLVQGYVPLFVKQALEAKMVGQYMVGITGEIGVGKSYVSNMLVERGAMRGILVHNIELDHIGHRILDELVEPVYQGLRQSIVRMFGSEVQLMDSKINRKVLGEMVFDDAEKLQQLNALMEKPLLMRLRRELYGKKGIILLNAALLAEGGLLELCNNNVVVVDCDDSLQRERLQGRGLSDQQIERRIRSQYSVLEKKNMISGVIHQHAQGRMWDVDTSASLDLTYVDGLLGEITNYFGLEMRT